MPVNKPTISHQLKTVKCPSRKATSLIHAIPNVVPLSSQNRSHLISTPSQPKQSSYNRNSGNLIDASNLSNCELKQCTKLLRNVLSSEAMVQLQLIRLKKNKSTSTDDEYCSKAINARSVAFKSPDQSFVTVDPHTHRVGRPEFIDGSDDRTDADSLTSSIVDRKSAILHNNNNNSPHSKPIEFVPFTTDRNTPSVVYCNCQSMHDSRPPHGSGDMQRNHGDQTLVCTRCHNFIPTTTVTSTHDKEAANAFRNKASHEDHNSGKLSDASFHNHNPSNGTHNMDYKSPLCQYSDMNDDKTDNLMSYLHRKINDLQCNARITRDTDLGRAICDIEQTFQQMVRENSLSSNHVRTIAKTLKWENSALKQKIKNQSESNRDMKSELKLIRQEQKQKIEELKLEVQLKNEEIRQMTERDKNNTTQMKEKYSSLEREYEKLRSDFQGQILQACHKDTDIIQLRHSCSQVEATLKEEIHSLTLANQNMKQELQVSHTQCKKYEQEYSHNQMVIKAAREQVVSLLDRHKLGRLETGSSSYRLESHIGDSSATGEWIHQATNLQQVLSMASENSDRPPSLHLQEQFTKFTPPTTWTTTTANYYSPSQLQNSDQSNLTNGSMNNFATTNFNNNYVSSSSYNPVHSDSTNPVSNYEAIPHKQQTNFLDIREQSPSPSNMSSTLSNNSLNTLAIIHSDQLDAIDKCSQIQPNSRRCSESIDSDIHEDPWTLPQPKYKMSSASSIMSTVSSLRSTDDREFRRGLKRLDSQICRLQNTLQSNLQCK